MRRGQFAHKINKKLPLKGVFPAPSKLNPKKGLPWAAESPHPVFQNAPVFLVYIRILIHSLPDAISHMEGSKQPLPI